MRDYVVAVQNPADDSWEIHFEVWGINAEEAAEKIANAETGEVGFSPRGAGRYLVAPASRVKNFDMQETPRFTVKKEEDEYA